jgi:hypothetical protein
MIYDKKTKDYLSENTVSSQVTHKIGCRYKFIGASERIVGMTLLACDANKQTKHTQYILPTTYHLRPSPAHINPFASKNRLTGYNMAPWTLSNTTLLVVKH